MNHDGATTSVAHSARTSGALASSHLLLLLANVETAAAARCKVTFFLRKEARGRRCTGELGLAQKPRRPSESE